MAQAYLRQLTKEKMNEAGKAELAWAFRRQLQEDLKVVEVPVPEVPVPEVPEVRAGDRINELRRELLTKDPSHSFSLAIYRKLVSDPKTFATLQTELLRHEQERNEINGTYEEFKNLESELSSTQDNLIALLSEMFKRAGQDPKPVHLAKRALLESKSLDLQEKLDTLKKKNPDVAALIEYDTIQQYSQQLRTTGFVWTKSRKKLLQDVLTGALTSRPVAALMGETGTGKTALARAASLELASREPERTVGGDQEKFVRLLASPAISEGRTYYEYGPLLRALTGKSSSIDTEPSKGGGIFFDDEFNTRPTSVQRQILKFVSEARVGRKVAVPGTPLVVEVQPGFLYLAAGNPPSERYDREETGIETKREFAGNVINVEYLEQSKDNPELYQVLLASLLDSQTGRLTCVTKGELEPNFIKDAPTGEYIIDSDPHSGGFLYRFANAWHELFQAFSHKDTVLHKKNPADPRAKWHLPTFVLDAGVVLSWIGQYKADPKARKEHIATFLTSKLTTYLEQFPEDEQKTVKEYLSFFDLSLETPKKDEQTKPPLSVLTPKDIGYLNPNVPRPKEKGAPPKFKTIDFLDTETGEVLFEYVAQESGFASGTKLVRKEGADDTLPQEATILGLLYNPDTEQTDPNSILIDGDYGHKVITPEDLTKWYDVATPPIPESGTPFAYDRVKAREYGFSELKIEKHEKAQAIIDAIYNRDPRFVTIFRAGSPDPDSTATPKALLTTDKYKVNKQALKTAWAQDCRDLPNTPEKSFWFFQALVEHQLSNTIDSDDPNNFTNPTKPHFPQFRQDSFLLAMDFSEFDYDNQTDKRDALSSETKKILQTLFNTKDPTSITRDEVNKALWTNHETRTQSPQARAVVRQLLGFGANPDDYELRLMRYDEYARASQTQNYGQKNLLTYFDGYYVYDNGHRGGLFGGDRGYGGAARVDAGARAPGTENLAVRLVLSRRNRQNT
ncbi:MAG: AAA family ATPase [Candidatus Eisenbacteria bacterium]|nr:AAA family ATPase [Candidatus Eisenbacteria bacterium]